jgi:hypothetical protein
MSKRPPIVDYDNNWKEAIEKHTFDAIAFFFPQLFPLIDTAQKPVFLEQEMRNIRRKSLKGRKRIVDKLIKVWLKNGEERWILIHIEVESSDKEGFSKRMYIYFTRAYDKYDVAIVSLALFVGEKIPPSHDYFEESNFGTKATYAYNVCVVINQDEQSLLKSDNNFALFILANLYTIETKDNMQRRLELKKKMYELALERNISLENLNSLLTFVFEIMTLPIEEANDYKKFRQFKEKAMTDTAFKKKRAKTHKDFADVYTKAAYDMYPSEMIKKLKEKDNVLKDKDNVLKEQDNVLKEQANVLKEKDNVLKEQANVLKEKDNVLREKDEILNRLIIRLYFQEQKTKEAIADLLGMPIEIIDNVILKSKIN